MLNVATEATCWYSQGLAFSLLAESITGFLVQILLSFTGCLPGPVFLLRPYSTRLSNYKRDKNS